MAVIKATNPKVSTLKQGVKYITNPKKAELITGKDCAVETALEEMQATKELYNKTDGRQYMHFVQSFKPDDPLDPSQAHQIGLEMAQKHFKGYEVLVATHTDKDHLHNHLIVNSVSFENGIKIQHSKNELKAMKELSDQICEREGLNVIREKGIGGYLSMNEYQVAIKRESWKFKTMDVIDQTKERTQSKEEFIKAMEAQGYQVNWTDTRKHITYTTPEGNKVRDNKLHDPKYLKEAMEKQMELKELNKEQRIIEQPQQQQQTVAEHLPGGAVRNLDRNDHQATREVQRSGRLGIEEYGFAKDEEMDYKKTLPKEDPIDPQQLRHDIKDIKPEQMAEQTAERLQELKAQYISLEQQIISYSQQNSQFRFEQRQLSGELEQMNKFSSSIEFTEIRIDQLKEQRGSLGLFKGKEKRRLDEQMKSLEYSRQQANGSFKRNFGVEPSQVQEQVQRLKEQSKTIQLQRENLPDSSKLREQQQTIEYQYKREKALSSIRPDKEKIETLLSKNQNSQGKEPIEDRIIRVRAESRLNHISQEDYKKIIKDVEPVQSKAMAEQKTNTSKSSHSQDMER